MSNIFTLSIETEAGKAHQYGFHLGTYEPLARQIAQERFHARVNNGYPTVTVALIRNGRLFDCYDGQWHSQI
jgi:hypothetical protein